MAVDRWSDVLALLACILGLVVVVAAWPRPATRRAAARDRHPASPVPLAVELDTLGDRPRWRIANRHAILDLTVDIVASRPSDTHGLWATEPIVEPLRLSPGRSTAMPSVVEDPHVAHDVVVAWTMHHLDGDASQRRTFHVPAGSDPIPAPVTATAAPGPMRGLTVVYGSIAALLCLGAVAAVWRLIERPVSSAGVTALPSSAPVPPAPTTSTAVAGEEPPPPTTASPPAAAAADAPTTTDSVPPATSAVATTSTTSPPLTTTTRPAGTTTTSAGPRVAIQGRIDACRFGPECLVASFRLVGLPDEGDYVCEFADGSRFTFRYDGDGADDACTASGRDPSITIEVDGVRSATITRDSPSGS